MDHSGKRGISRRQFVALTSAAMPLGGAALAFASGGGDAVAPQRHGRGYRIDTRISSQNQDSRVRTLVLHYTAEDLASSLASLTQTQYQVSSHYLVPDGSLAAHVYQLVPDEARAWHAGVSAWRGDTMLNASSIGVEIVNLGYPAEDETLPLMQRHWYAFEDAQIEVVGRLARDLVDRYALPPYQVVGHTDVAPGRKVDPGPLFPWQRLYERYGVGAWPDQATVDALRSSQPYDGDIGALQAKLARYGYGLTASGVLDQATVDAVSAFQMHFRPARYDGVPDLDTVAILDALLAKYFPPAAAAAALAGPAAGERNEKGD